MRFLNLCYLKAKQGLWIQAWMSNSKVSILTVVSEGVQRFQMFEHVCFYCPVSVHPAAVRWRPAGGSVVPQCFGFLSAPDLLAIFKQLMVHVQVRIRDVAAPQIYSWRGFAATWFNPAVTSFPVQQQKDQCCPAPLQDVILCRSPSFCQVLRRSWPGWA